MEWGQESKKAFIQALNIEFLTTTGNYTNFQYKKSEIHMLFTSKQKEECKKYLELVIQEYKNALTSHENTFFDFNSFPFCIGLGIFSVKSNRGVKFKISLSDEILHNLYHMFMNQIFLLKMNNMPDCVGLTGDDRKNKGYIAGWLFSQENNHGDLRKEEMIIELLDKYTFRREKKDAVIKGKETPYHCIYVYKHGAEKAIQKAVQDFPKELLSRYPKSLLMLSYIFCSNLESQKVNDEYRKFVEGWGREGAIEIDKNTVRFSCNKGLVDKEMKMKRNVGMAIKEINILYKTRNFISFNQGNNGNLEQVFTFDLSNINSFIRNIPCDIGYVKEAQELAYKQLNGIVTPSCNIFPSSSKRSSLRVSSKSSDVAGSTSLKRDSLVKSDKSNDSALGAYASSTGYSDTELRRNSNSKSFDSGNHSRPSSSDMADLGNSEQGLNKVRSSKDMRFYRSGSLPLCKGEKVLDAVKVEKVVNFDSLRSELLTK